MTYNGGLTFSQKGPLQLQKLDRSLAGDVVFAAKAYDEYHHVGLLTQRIMEGEGGGVILEDTLGRKAFTFDCSGFAFIDSCWKSH